jgi:hypothetical protein
VTDEQWDYDPEEPPNEALRNAAEQARKLVRHADEEAEYAEAFEGTDDDEDEEEDERPRSEVFEVMTPTEFNEHRLEAWEMAYMKLHFKDGKPRDWGDYTIDPADVLLLMRAIEGDELGDG